MDVKKEFIKATARRLTIVPVDQKEYVEKIPKVLSEITEKEFTI